MTKLPKPNEFDFDWYIVAFFAGIMMCAIVGDWFAAVMWITGMLFAWAYIDAKNNKDNKQ